jgi:N-acetylglucosaminyldiphosphoundecaprenol N-acetyl-beta-D-mannosaminyltransferase
MNCKLFEKIGK